MKFSKDTSRLVEGRVYWCVHGGEPHLVQFVAAYRAPENWWWGDEVILPTVEVEPERPAAPELLPCPFCGGTDLRISDLYSDKPGCQYWVQCGSCETDGPIRERHAGAYVGWNTRAAPPAPTPAPVEPKPAWTPRVCPVGQFYRDYTPPGGE